jgi:hypothetical protein
VLEVEPAKIVRHDGTRDDGFEIVAARAAEGRLN